MWKEAFFSSCSCVFFCQNTVPLYFHFIGLLDCFGNCSKKFRYVLQSILLFLYLLLTEGIEVDNQTLVLWATEQKSIIA